MNFEKDMQDESVEKLRTELNECRDHLSNLIAAAPKAVVNNDPHFKAAANWLANWDGKRLYE